jgi:hypothetical protein
MGTGDQGDPDWIGLYNAKDGEVFASVVYVVSVVTPLAESENASRCLRDAGSGGVISLNSFISQADAAHEAAVDGSS